MAALKPLLLFHGCGVGQMHRVARIDSALDPPLPMIGRFHHASGAVGLGGRQISQDDIEIMGHAFFADDLVVCIK
jgi:hypothetical protein